MAVSPNKLSARAIVDTSLVYVGVLLLTLYAWMRTSVESPSISALTFALFTPTDGTPTKYLLTTVLAIGVFPVVITALYFFFRVNLFTSEHRFSHPALNSTQVVCNKLFCRKKLNTSLALGFAIFSVAFVAIQWAVPHYISASLNNSDFFERNYVNPATVSLKFPVKKRNVVYIILESMETTYQDKASGGIENTNLIPRLSALAQDKNNFSFSSNEKLSGISPATGTEWTAAAMIAQTSGVPVKLPLDTENPLSNSFAPGAWSIGEVLQAHGYKQVLMVGSDADFGARRHYFSQHGAYEIFDYEYARKTQLVGDPVAWGFRDDTLYRFAKEKLAILAKGSEPFNFTMLTVDTHAPGGDVCDQCGNAYDDRYKNVISCADRQVADFIGWIQQQPFYENTTIVVVGDHVGMDSQYHNNVPEGYKAHTYNVIINSVAKTTRTKNRICTSFDLYPTTLASMGVKIEGEQLGLGVNLFSTYPTLAEKYGLSEFNENLMQASDYYNTVILQVPKGLLSTSRASQ